MKNNGILLAAVMYSKENIRAGLGRYRLASDRVALHQRKPGRSRIWED